jgi:glycine hydroxymethyltransferase
LSHGYQTETKQISMVSKYFTSIPYRLNEDTGLIDYDECEKFALRIRPKILIAGTSAYSRLIDYKRMRQIADKCGAYLLADMAHISGLVVAGTIPSPFEYADVVTTTTHKSLRGPRGAMIFFRRGQKGVDKKGSPIMFDLEERINAAVFPGLQGGPHNQSITALAVALKQAMQPEFKTYQEQVMKNAKALGESLKKNGFDLVSGGTDNHLVLINLRSKGVNGSKSETVCDMTNIVLNKNTIPGDKSAMTPNGLRVGAPAMTSRGLVEEDFMKIGDFISSAVDIAVSVEKQSGPKLVDFKRILKESPPGSLLELKSEVEDFASRFPTVGF